MTRPSYSIFLFIKILIGAGMLVVTLGLVFFFADILNVNAVSVFVQLAVAGTIVVAMSFLSIKIFRGLEYV